MKNLLVLGRRTCAHRKDCSDNIIIYNLLCALIFLLNMTGLNGLPGDKGDRGLPGVIDFKQLPKGRKGEPGLNGLRGFPGKDGIKGQPGLQGEIIITPLILQESVRELYKFYGSLSFINIVERERERERERGGIPNVISIVSREIFQMSY